IAPQGTDLGGAGLVWRREDEAAVLAAIDDFVACYSVDRRRIILDGWSAGGIMSYWLGLRHAKRFAGISIQAADLASAEIVNGAPLVPAPATIPISHV
ncbi:prolyl oligopeptidase family serine peptidase, partial [Enterococcus casseliflavus]|uniref:prolyl oligopeptidase family serine peptidase n=1 Tax=Enterococcus casseliflavus TaxID=37734 RepID=UPI003D1051D1